MTLAPQRGSQTPRIMHVPEAVSSTWEEARELLDLANVHLDPWQELVVSHALGENAEGRWAAFEVGLNVPRQNGKGEILLARELIGLFVLEESFQVHSAHQVDTAVEAFRRLVDVIEACPDLDQRMKRAWTANGRESVELKNGCRIRFRSRSRGGGRGFTGDALYLDEAMFLPEYAIGALMPSLSGRSLTGDPQIWYAGSAVDQTVQTDGIVFSRLRERALTGTDPALAYFEWSVDADSPDDVGEQMATSETAWAEANPGLGIRISESHVAREQRSMDKRTFAVERLGAGDYPSGDGTGETMLPIEDWLALANPDSVIVDPVCIGVDVTVERKSSVVAAGRSEDGLWHVEMLYSEAGTGWVADRLLQLHERHEVSEFVVDAYGPSGAIARRLEDAGVNVRSLDTNEFVGACAGLVDAVGEGTLVHLGQAEFTEAVRGARSRPLVDRWAWSRNRSGPQIGVLVAASIALYSAVDNDSSGGIAIF